MNALDTMAMRLLQKKLDEWAEKNIRALANGGSLDIGDFHATALQYSSAVAYIRALTDVRETLCKEVEDELRANS